MFRKITKRHWTLIILSILLILTFYFILPISIPLVVAFITALILNPAVQLLEKKFKLSRQISVIIIFFLFIVLIGILGTFTIMITVTQIVNFVEKVPTYFKQLHLIYLDWEAHFRQYARNLPPEFVKQVTNSFQENLTALSDKAREIFTIDNIAQIVSKIPQYLISLIVYIIALFLFMIELPILKVETMNLMKESTAEKVRFMGKRLSEVMLGFLKAQFLLSLIIFGASLIGLFMIAPDVAIIMSLIIWIIDLIPIVGSIIILGPWSLFMFLTNNVTMGIQLAILAIVLLAIRRIVEPKVMGKQIGLSPLITLIAMFLGLKLLGFLGFILGPLIVITYRSAKEANIINWNIKI
ncbi:sporulation integral membrane protein YtvI [Cerasibacillus quisquiliarum]|uniref:Sporulation integral membrane protein YtvI n=1 Tax=Cerasibacillus quisquiliarum TaxID=227865 RepID=A0A511UUP0_9BACI|nr:sporulation integral membrane protein YtvI [Cerasibacillus quisquiliarum]MBB5145748.1 sporulation integral membrane protein YtvI [Cerasibacillus quisquiliarum]GEN30319.1 sporulation integral membrane protein YtvI [Cerasibacillus quisquiliarum]